MSDCIKFEFQSSHGCIEPALIQDVVVQSLSTAIVWLFTLIAVWYISHLVMLWVFHIFPKPKEPKLTFTEADAFIEHCRSWFDKKL